MKKGITAAVFILIIIAAVIMMVTSGVKSEILPIGGKLPLISIKTLGGSKNIQSDGKAFLIIYFSKNCPHCRYELKLLDDNTESLKDITVYLITADTTYLQGDDKKKYARLLRKKNIIFGMVDKEEYKEKLGSGVTPALYFFDKDAVLRAKINGETKLSRIIKEIKKSSRGGFADERNAGGIN